MCLQRGRDYLSVCPEKWVRLRPPGGWVRAPPQLSSTSPCDTLLQIESWKEHEAAGKSMSVGKGFAL